jgi:hypothetical protein
VGDNVQQAIDRVADRDAGWVYRRDAADWLGGMAARALAALHAQEDDPDVDVRTAVQDALRKARTGLEADAGDGPGGYTLRALAEYCRKPGSREVAPDGEGFVIHATRANGRRQRVYLTPFAGYRGRAMVRIHSSCGAAPDARTLHWALERNMELNHCALGLMERDGEERLALVRCYPLSHAGPALVKATVKEMAYYGDWIEERLGGGDRF